jgi:hypothetical protein
MPMKHICTCDFCGKAIKFKPRERHEKTLYILHGNRAHCHEDCCLYFCNKCWDMTEVRNLRTERKELQKRHDREWRDYDNRVLAAIRPLKAGARMFEKIAARW